MLRLRSAGLILCVVFAGWAMPALAQHARTANTAVSATAMLVLLTSLAFLIVPRTPRARFVTRPATSTKVRRKPSGAGPGHR